MEISISSHGTMGLVRTGVVGAGSFGTAIAQALKVPVTLWGRSDQVIESIQRTRRNKKYFPDVQLREGIEATNHMEHIRDCPMIFLCVPASATRTACELIGKDYKGILVICSKGVEESGKLMHEVVKETNPFARIAILSGPNFATDLIMEEHCITTIATQNQDHFDVFKENVEIHFCCDVPGVAVCGVFKNVLALTCGLAQGADINLSTQAAILFKGFQEMEELLLKKGGKLETIKTPAGFGDLWLTTIGPNSRNYKAGVNLVKNQKSAFLSEGLSSLTALAESSDFCASLQGMTQELSKIENYDQRKAMVRKELARL